LGHKYAGRSITATLQKSFGCDLNEDAGGRGEHSAVGVAEFGGAAMFATTTAVEVTFRPAYEDEVTFKWHGAEIVDGHVARHGDDVAMTIGLAHGFIEHGGNDAAVGVSGRSLKLSGQTHAAENALVCIDEELQVEAGIIVVAATEATVQRSVRQKFLACGCALSHAVSDHL